MWRPEGTVKDSLGHWGFLDLEIKMLQHDIGILLHVSHLISPQIAERVFWFYMLFQNLTTSPSRNRLDR